ncbi:MAG: 6-phosphogluconolactonase [Woeseiaceae bacterium]|nr:6-phosphogluconolactonase [Woeseiaceae bacterium]
MEIERFSSRDEASLAAAGHIAAAVNRRIDAQGKSSLVVSGGTTPARCFAALAETELPWSNVHVVLSDERWVPADHEDSNERLVRETLFTGHAKDARLLSVYHDELSPDEGAVEVDAGIRKLPFPFACSLLGMGADGHFASLFPDADGLDDGLDPDYGGLATAVSTAASPHPRISLTLAALSRSDSILLLVFGDDKWQTLEAAQAADSALPVAKLLKQNRAPVSIYWAP